MSSSPCVHEVLIVYDDDGLEGARGLQRRLLRQGLRAGLAQAHETGLAERAREVWRFRSRDGKLPASVLTAAPDGGVVMPVPDLAGPASWPSRRALKAHRSPHAGGPLTLASLREANRRSYDALAVQFTDVWFDSVPVEAIESFMRWLPRGGLVLDAGCGPGHHAAYFRRRGFEPVGLDISNGMLAVARAKVAGVPFVHGDLMRHQLPAACFDGIWSAVAFNHIPAEEVQAALAHLVAALKPGGVIGLNLQVGRPSELISRGPDRRFFEYPPDAEAVAAWLSQAGIWALSMQTAIVTRNTHGLPLTMRFATVVGRRDSNVAAG